MTVLSLYGANERSMRIMHWWNGTDRETPKYREKHLHVPTVLKSGSLNLLEPSGPVQACNGIALPFNFFYPYTVEMCRSVGDITIFC